MTTPRIVIVPGWRGSGPGHWQTEWAKQLPNVRRVEQENWDNPGREAWVARLSDLILSEPGPVVLVGHSLGCITIAHLPPDAASRVAGALLVAPAEPARRAVLSDFAPVPHHPLPYPSIVVASSNDPYCSPRMASAYARSWGGEFVRIQNAGHINIESGHGDWSFGLALLHSLLPKAQLRPSNALYAAQE